MQTLNRSSLQVLIAVIAINAAFAAIFIAPFCISAKGNVDVEYYNAKIVSPLDGTIVSSPIDIIYQITGTIPKSRYVWILVNPHSTPGQYWPQGNNHTKSINGTYPWIISLGGENDNGKNFDVLLVEVDESTDKRFVNLAEQGKRTGIYPSVMLPDNPKILDRITLIRQITLSILSPINGTMSQNYIDVTGNISGIIPKGKYIWIVVGPRYSYGDWYPQGKDHLSPGPQNDWGMQARIGSENEDDLGKIFDIRAILVDKDIDEQFRNWASKGNELIANGENSENAYPPLKFPENATILSQTTIIREK